MIKILCRIALVGIAAALLAAGGLWEDARPADVGVVFGNKVEPSGEPSPSLASRLEKAAQLYHRGLFPRVIVSGGLGKEGWDEAQVTAAHAERFVLRDFYYGLLREGVAYPSYLFRAYPAE